MNEPPRIKENLPNKDLDHLRLLSIFHFIVGGLALFGLCFLALHYFIMRTVFFNPEFWKSPNPTNLPPQAVFKVLIAFYIFVAIMLVLSSVLNVLSGIFLRQRTNRTFSIVVACLNCLHIPLGTVLGVFTIVVLMRDSVREIYGERSGPS